MLTLATMLPGTWALPSGYAYILGGVGVTLQYTFLSLALGLVGAVVLAAAKLSSKPYWRALASVYTSVFRGTPLLVQLSLVYFALPGLLNPHLSAFTASILTFGLNSAAYVSEILRAGIHGVQRGQFEAALALGLPRSLMMRDIILPQALRNILPSLVNEVIDLSKETAIVSTLGVADIMRRANVVAAEQYNFLEPLLVAALSYYCIVLVLATLAKRLERWLKQPRSRS
jgi:His/Glu/Gln/Arg/opine family amino acid ABC transporter permease subunit